MLRKLIVKLEYLENLNNYCDESLPMIATPTGCLQTAIPGPQGHFLTPGDGSSEALESESEKFHRGKTDSRIEKRSETMIKSF